MFINTIRQFVHLVCFRGSQRSFKIRKIGCITLLHKQHVTPKDVNISRRGSPNLSECHLEQSVMMSAASYLSADYKQSSTPLVPNKHIMRPRVLTKEENIAEPRCSGDWSQWRELEKPRWDNIESPQFIDFFNIPDSRDSFFDQTVIASTPKPNAWQAESANETQEESLVNSVDNISISTVIANDDVANNSYNIGSNNNENAEPHITVQQKKNKVGPAPLKRDNRQNQIPVRIATKPSTFEVRAKQKVAVKEETKWKGFKANPMPKFLKDRPPLITKKTKDQNTHSTEKDINANEEEKKPNTFKAFAVPKVSKENLPTTSNKLHGKQRQEISDNRIKKSIEIWKRKPFIPQPSQKDVDRPRSPRLSTAARAKERKRFDDALKEKEKEQEHKKEMEELARKKKEEDEIAQLRKMTVHKAHPIRKYKSGLPQVVKRPLTDPISPKLLKRRRYK